MDRLDSRITQLRLEVDDLKRQVQLKTVELEALVQASKLRPAVERDSTLRPATQATSPLRVIRRGGRQPGSISTQWRQFLQSIVVEGNAPVARDAFINCAAEYFNLQKSSIRQRLRQHIAAGILQENGDQIAVSEAAIERYRLNKLKHSGPTVSSEALNGSGVSAPEIGG